MKTGEYLIKTVRTLKRHSMPQDREELEFFDAAICKAHREWEQQKTPQGQVVNFAQGRAAAEADKHD